MAEIAPDPLDRFAQSWRAYALIALIALASALFGAGAVPVMDRDEARFAQASRQMVETGDYVRIRVQDEERSKKPVGIHWLQAASVQLFEPITHRLNAIWPYRMPSALGALMAALAAFWAGRALIGPRAALLGAALFAASLSLGFEGMTAKTDAALAGFTTLALAAAAHLFVGAKRPRAMALLFWTAMGAAILIKGPIAPLVALLTLAPLGLWERRWRWMKPLAWWPGPLLMLLIVLPWMIAIYFATQGRFFAEAIGHDLGSKIAGGSEGHSGWPGYHTLLLPLMIFPATFALPFAARIGWQTLRAPRAEETLRGLRFLLAWVLPSFIMFELTPNKLPHYPLPVYPAIALLCGAGIIAALDGGWHVAKWIGVALTALVGAALVTLIIESAQFLDSQGLAQTLGVAMAIVATLALATFALVRQPAARVGAAVICALMLSFSVRQIILPQARGAQSTAEAVAALERAHLSGRPLWVIGYRETSIVFATRTDAHLTSAEDAGQHANPGDGVIVEQHDLAALQGAFNSRDLAFMPSSEPVHARNLGNGHRVALSIGAVQLVARN